MVDDDPEVPRALEFCLEKVYDVVTASSGEEAVEIAGETPIAVVILDLHMKGMTGIETLRKLREINRYQKIIILTGHEDKESAIAALNLGAFRYLLKPFDLTAMKRATAEAFLRYRQEVEVASSALSTPAQLKQLGLTKRATEIVFRMARGETNTEIAAQLAISRRTVEKHIEAIYRRLNISSRMKVAPRLRELLPGLRDAGKMTWLSLLYLSFLT